MLWQKIGRCIPLVTTCAAILIGAMSSVGYFELSLADTLIIGLLALLAIDALVERLSLLEQINAKLQKLLRVKKLNEGGKKQCVVTKAQDLSQHNYSDLANPAHCSDLQTLGGQCDARISQANQSLHMVIVESPKDGNGIIIEIRQRSP